MLRDSFDKAEDDHKHRLLAESQVEADRIIYDLQSALQLDAKYVLTTEEIENLHLFNSFKNCCELNSISSPSKLSSISGNS